MSRRTTRRARSFVAELLGKAAELADMPRAFPVVPRYAHLDVRRRVHGSYSIFYRVVDERVTVIHVLHGARDYEALLFPEG